MSEEEPQKACCGISATTTVSMRWFIVVIAIIGISCTVAGTALGAAYSNGREQLTYSLLMIGECKMNFSILCKPIESF